MSAFMTEHMTAEQQSGGERIIRITHTEYRLYGVKVPRFVFRAALKAYNLVRREP